MDKLRVEVQNVDGETMSPEDLLNAAKAAGWTDYPGDGKAVMMLDERGNPAYEVPNPMPFAPPIGWTPTPPLDELIRQSVRRELALLRESDVLEESEEDLIDFDIPDELPELSTVYEFVDMQTQGPRVAKEPTAAERAKADAEYQELLSDEKAKRLRHRQEAARKQRDELDRVLGGSNERIM